MGNDNLEEDVQDIAGSSCVRHHSKVSNTSRQMLRLDAKDGTKHHVYRVTLTTNERLDSEAHEGMILHKRSEVRSISPNWLLSQNELCLQ